MLLNRVLLIPSRFYPDLGGVETMSEILAKTLSDFGIQVKVATNRWPRDRSSHFLHDGISVHTFSMRSLDGGVRAILGFIIYFIPTLISFVFFVRKFRPDVINVHCLSINAFYGCLAGLILRIPVVLTTHSEITMDEHRSYHRNSMLNRLLPYVVRNSNALTGCSQSTLELFIDHIKIQPVHTVVIPNGVVVDTPVDVLRSDELLFVGRLVKQKGLDVLLSAMVGTDCKLKIVGDGPERSALEELTLSLNLRDRVEFLGPLSRKDIHSLLLQCKCLCVPSTGIEGLPMVILEALSTQTFVLASAVGGIPEVIVSGETGSLLECGNIADWHSSLLRLDEIIGKQCANSYQALYNSVDMVRAYIDVYKHVMGGCQ